MRILVLHPGALGDVILSLPALRALRRRFPRTHLVLAGNTDFLEVVSRGCAEVVVSLTTLPLHRLRSEGPIPDQEVRWWRSFDRIVSWTGSKDEAFRSAFRRVHSGALVAPWMPESGESRHVSQIFLDSLAPLTALTPSTGALDVDRRNTVCLHDAHLEQGRSWLIAQGWKGERIVALHPGAGSPGKRWSEDGFKRLISLLLADTPAKILIIEGPAERGIGESVARDSAASRMMLARDMPLSVVAGALAHCAVFIGNDSGVTHLAAGLHVPSVVLFRSTAHRQWGPIGDQVWALRAKSTTSEFASIHEHATVDLQALADHVARLVGGKESDRASHFFTGPCPLAGDYRDQLLE